MVTFERGGPNGMNDMSSFHPSRTCTGSSVWQTNVWRNDFVYDGKLRRRVEKDFTWNAGTASWQQTNEVHFVYDGNLVVQERSTNNLPTVTYTRGIDLSGSFQGAGGIGGLLARTENSRLRVADPNATAYYHCEGNGNVTCLINAYQQIAAKYLYDPFGNTLAMSGPLAGANSYRFSSKEWNGNSGLYYYLYRFYDPNLQRWVNRDPIQELGGKNQFNFCLNIPNSVVDLNGLNAGTWVWPVVEAGEGTVITVSGAGAVAITGTAVGITVIAWPIFFPPVGPVAYPPTYLNQINAPPISIARPICDAVPLPNPPKKQEDCEAKHAQCVGSGLPCLDCLWYCRHYGTWPESKCPTSKF